MENASEGLSFIEAINHALGLLALGLLLGGEGFYWVSYLVQNLQKYSQAIRENKKPKLSRREVIFQWFLLGGFLLMFNVLFLGLPFIVDYLVWSGKLVLPLSGYQYLISRLKGQLAASWPFSLIQWVFFSITVSGIVYYFGHENGERRWIYSTAGHLAVLLIGWLMKGWLGMIFISLPTFFAYYAFLYQISDILLPASYPKEEEQDTAEKARTKEEKRKRFIILAAFTWGIQFPILVSGEHAWKPPETLIRGDFTWDYPVPGLLWTRSHEVVAITDGTQFKRVDGPGVIFTGKLERALQVIDLRLQLRTSEIDVVTKDGVSLKARVFTAFRMDNEEWDEKTYEEMRSRNVLMRGANRLDYTRGSFPHARARIRAAISTTATWASDPKTIVPWDQWALKVVESEARKVIALKNLDELWRPVPDKPLANALENIANEIKANVFPILRAAGILVYAARVVNFSFPAKKGETNQILERQIASWKSIWMQKRAERLAQAAAEAEKMQAEARAYAQAMLLGAIAEGLQKAKEKHPQLHRYVIAMRFFSALQEYIRAMPAEAQDAESQKKIANLQAYLQNWQSTFFPGEEKLK
jgi:regulator of protease activity HflC (stomatin/prohibitin superfamily)